VHINAAFPTSHGVAQSGYFLLNPLHESSDDADIATQEKAIARELNQQGVVDERS